MNKPLRFRGGRRRAVLAALTVAALLAGFLQGSPATAAEEPVPVDRPAVVSAWTTGGPQVRAAAEIALLGSDDQIRAFLEGGWLQAQRLDERDAVLDVLGKGGPAVRAAAKRALDAADAGDDGAIPAFLKRGWQAQSNIDARVSVNQLMTNGGPQVREAAQKVLDAGDPEGLRKFAESGWQVQWVTDQRLRVNQAMATGGAQVKAAGQRALDARTPEALEHFLEYGWAVASARDDELATLTDLLAQAEAAGALAAQETQFAKDEAARAKEAAESARRAAEAAAAATEAARDNTEQAAAHAKRAAFAAEQAAQSARVAVGAAAAASRAARAAATAAARTAAAASRAEQAAAAARKAAADAATDESKADEARRAAEVASRIAAETRSKLVLALTVDSAINAGMFAVEYANSAAANAELAAAANDDAVLAANEAGANAADAVAAAQHARAAATRARRAAEAAERYLNVAKAAAASAQQAANRAVENAEAAARAAIEAAEHAGEAVHAATRATEHAAAATVAAQAAVDAATQAGVVSDAARRADTERLAVAKDQGVEAARVARSQYDAQERMADWDTEEAAKRDAETNRLLAVARDPAKPQAEAAAAGRRVALNLVRAQGKFTREAALAALGGSDDQVVTFARTGLEAANARDDRQAVMNLVVTDNAALSTAARAALDGSDADVREFLRTQNYPGRITADRIKVNQILTAAKAAGDTVTAQRAQAALDAGTLQALRDFLDTGQYVAAATGERIRVNQILTAADSGPELKAAAQVALDGPPTMLRQFLGTERYLAAERDHESAAHLAMVGGLLEKINQVAETATQNALEAQAVAARARGDAEQAVNYANQAAASAVDAAEYAERAQEYANDAAQSVQKAAAAVTTARNAATQANASARSAIRSATWAVVSHGNAIKAAQDAHAAAKSAYDSAFAAYQDAELAGKAAATAFDVIMYDRSVLIAQCVDAFEPGSAGAALEQLYTGQSGQAVMACVSNVAADPAELANRAYRNSATCAFVYPEGSQGYNDCLQAVLDPMFHAGQQMTLMVEAVKAMAAGFVLPGIAAAVGCMLTACSLALGALLTVGEVGLNVFKLINGDQSLAQTLLNLGALALEALLLRGLAGALSAGFQAVKALHVANTKANGAISRLRESSLRHLMTLELTSCLRRPQGFAPTTLTSDTRRTRVLVSNPVCFEAEFLPGDWFRSPAGLLYGPDHGNPQAPHKIFHVMAHALPNPDKPIQSLWADDLTDQPGKIFKAVDEAWLKRQDWHLVEEQPGLRTKWRIPMDRQVGTDGERNICMWVKRHAPESPYEVQTAYPCH